MNKPEHFEMAEGYASYRPDGEISLQKAIDWVSTAITFAVDQRITKLLVDSTKLTGFGPPLTWERFRLGERLAYAAKGAAIKVVLVARPEMVDPERFGMTVARNRGLLANVFTSEADALAWLLDPNAT